MNIYADADHTGDSVTRRSRTGFLIYLNLALMYWHSKKQTLVGTSTFGNKFLAMKHCKEYIRGLWFKLKMMGIRINGPVFVYGDSQFVLANTTGPYSALKKSNSIAFHFVWEEAARDERRTAYIESNENTSDSLTKCFLSEEKRRKFGSRILYHFYVAAAA